MSKVMEEGRHSSTTYFLPVTKGKNVYKKATKPNTVSSDAQI
jgi:hypothetical protein